MPSDNPNPNMDKLLRDYARKRRDAAGPMEMHAATRKMLQGEVSRTLGKKAPEAQIAEPKIVFWRRFVWAGAALAIAAVLLLSTAPFLTKSKDHTTQLAAMKDVPSKTAPIPTASSAPVADEFSAPATVAEDRIVPSGHVAPGAASVGGRLEEFKSRNFKKENDAVSGSGASVANEAVTRSRSAESSIVTDTDKRKPLVYGDPVRTPSESIVSGVPRSPAPKTEALSAGEKEVFRARQEPAKQLLAGESKSSSVSGSAAVPQPGTFSKSFVQQDLRLNYRRNLQSPAQPNVLSNFQMVWSDSHLKIIDGDGSVYEGEIQKVLPETEKMVFDTIARSDGAANKKPARELNQKESHQNVSFRVSGLNRTLNRQIVFEGTNLIMSQTSVITGLAKQAADLPKAEQPKALADKKDAAGNKKTSVIQGSINVGGTNEYRIQAIESP